MHRAWTAFAWLSLLLLVAAPAAADTKAYDVLLREGPDCPDGGPACIVVEAANEQASGAVEAPSTLQIEGLHPIELNVVNEGTAPHNLTFEPGTPAGNFSHDEPIMSGENATISIVTIAEVPAGEYAFYSSQGADREAGMTGSLVVEEGSSQDGTQANSTGSGDDQGAGNGTEDPRQTPDEGNATSEEDAVPAAGPLAAILTGAAAAAASRRR